MKGYYFSLTSSEFFRLHSSASISQLYALDDVTIKLHRRNAQPLIIGTNDPLFASLNSLEGTLKFIKVNPSCDVEELNNIGYYWNKFIKEPTDVDSPFFKGQHYHLWSSNTHTATWLYPKDNNIIFEVTPTFPGFAYKASKKLSFENFMQNYRPLFRCAIEPHTIKAWEVQTHKLLAIIRKNSGFNK